MHITPPKCDTVIYVNFPIKEVYVQLDCNSLIPNKKLNIENLTKGAIPIERDLNDYYANLIYDLDQNLNKDNSSFWSEFISKADYFCCGRINVHKGLSTYVILINTPLNQEAYMFNVDKENFLTSIIGIASKGTFSIIHFTKRNSIEDFTYLGLAYPSEKNNLYSESSFSIDKMGFCHINKKLK